MLVIVASWTNLWVFESLVGMESQRFKSATSKATAVCNGLIDIILSSHTVGAVIQDNIGCAWSHEKSQLRVSISEIIGKRHISLPGRICGISPVR
jgi:hypothetical protein